jgi:hypothetical protein
MDTNDESAPFLEGKALNDEPPASPLLKLWNRFLGLFIAVSVGIYAGVVSRTAQEAWLYATIFCSEALICAAIAVFLKTYTFKKALTGFSAYFLISAFLAPSARWARDYFGD